jgi:hypothetical protein
MRTKILSLIALTPLYLGATGAAIENGAVRIEVSGENGSITHVLDKRSNTDYIADPEHARLFRLLVPRQDYPTRRVESSEQKVDSIKLADGVLTIHFTKLQISPHQYVAGAREIPEPVLNTEATVTMRLEGEHVHLGLVVANHGPEQITDVAFPWIAGLTRKSEGRQAHVILPSLGQRSFSQTADFVVAARAKSYPALLAASWMNYEFEGKGFGIEARSAPEAQDALISLNEDSLARNSPHSWGESGIAYLAWNFYPHIAGQQRWEAPEVILHVHGTDWRTMASEHREWYRQHFTPTRSDAFDRSIGFATYRLKREDNTVNWTYGQLPKLADEAKSAGIANLVIDGWREREGNWNSGPFDEVADPRMGGGEKLKSLIETLHRQGVEMAFAFHPTMVNTASIQYAQTAYRWTIKTRIDGNQIAPNFTYITYDYPYEDYSIHYWAQLDPSSPATDFLLQEARRMRDEYGFRNLFLRGVGLATHLSYRRYNSVPPQRVYVDGYARFLGGLKKIFPHGMLLTEGMNDLVNPYASAGYTWTQSENPDILALSIPWTPFSNDVEALDYDQANASFARKVLINLIVDGGDGSVGRYPEFARHLKALQALKEATQPYYAEAEFRDREGLKPGNLDSEVVAAVFDNETDHKTGLVLANLADTRKKVTVGFTSKEVPQEGHLYRLNGRSEYVALQPEATVDLGPYEVAVLGIDRDGKSERSVTARTR